LSRTRKDKKDFWKTFPHVREGRSAYSHRRFLIPSWYKYMTKRARRAKCKQAARAGKEIPIFKNRDGLYW